MLKRSLLRLGSLTENNLSSWLVPYRWFETDQPEDGPVS
jgi:hypothetical protein